MSQNQTATAETSQLSPQRQQRLDFAKRSPEIVARHDKQAWLDLFATDGLIEDPVGSAPHGGNKPQQRPAFYESFIAPNDVRFEVHGDIVNQDHVVRDVTIHVTMSSGAQVSVPTYILYELTEQNGALKVQRLAAHWELRKMIPQVLTQGLRGLKTMLGLTVRMLQNQGLLGSLGYSKGMLFGVFGRGKRIVQQFVAAVNRGDAVGLDALFGPGGAHVFHGKDATSFRATEFLGAVEGTMYISHEISAGYYTVARYRRVVGADDVERGVMFCRFAPSRKSNLISVRMYGGKLHS